MTRIITTLLTALLALSVSTAAFAARMQDSQRFATCANTFSATGGACVTDVRDYPLKNFALQCYESHDSSTTYTVVLEGSLDGSHYTTLLTRTNAIPDSVTWTTAASPARYVSLRASALASNKTVKCRFQGIQ